MADESMDISLGGRKWTLRQLPWRYTKAIQPELHAVYKRLVNAAAPGGSLVVDDLDAMGSVVFKMISNVDPDLTNEQFEDLPSTVEEMRNCLPAIGRALGLKFQASAGAEAPAEDAGK